MYMCVTFLVSIATGIVPPNLVLELTLCLVLVFLDRSVLLVSSVNFTLVIVSSCTCVLHF